MRGSLRSGQSNFLVPSCRPRIAWERSRPRRGPTRAAPSRHAANESEPRAPTIEPPGAGSIGWPGTRAFRSGTSGRRPTSGRASGAESSGPIAAGFQAGPPAGVQGPPPGRSDWQGSSFCSPIILTRSHEDSSPSGLSRGGGKLLGEDGVSVLR